MSQLNADRKSDWNIFKPEGICTPIYSRRHSQVIRKSVLLVKKVKASKINTLLSACLTFKFNYSFCKTVNLVCKFAGEGDSGDIWEVVCKGHNWQRDDAIQLRHSDTDAFLAASGNTYGRPIHGQMEIIGISSSDSSCYWKATEGIFIHPSEAQTPKSTSNEYEHNEL